MFQYRPEIELRITRRSAMQRAVLGLGALALGGSQLGRGDEPQDESAPADDASKKTPGSIDGHVHVWTPDTERYPLAKGYRIEDMQPPRFTPEELFSHARPCGVSRVVLIQMSFYGFDNSYMLDAMRQHPGVFSGVAVIDENAQPADKMRRLAKEGVRGFRIHPGDRPVATWLDGPGMAAMWKCGGEEGLAMCHLINPNSLPLVDRMCRKFPDTPVVIDHFACIGEDGEVRSADVEQLAELAKHEHTSVKVSAFYALGKKQAPYLDLAPMIRRLLDAYGPERLMWASDCPYQVDPGHTYSDSIDLIKDRLDFLSDGDKEWLLRKTAERVFFPA
jgi:predicted TIM-barrel fold metal-dependent hydrolase